MIPDALDAPEHRVKLSAGRVDSTPVPPHALGAPIVTCFCGVITARTVDHADAIARTARHVRVTHCLSESRALFVAGQLFASAERPTPAPPPAHVLRLVPSPPAREERPVTPQPWHVEALALMADGMGDKAIARRLGMSTPPVHRLRHAHGIAPHPRGGRRESVAIPESGTIVPKAREC